MRDVKYLCYNKNTVYCVIGVDVYDFFSRKEKRKVQGMRLYLFTSFTLSTTEWNTNNEGRLSIGAEVFSFYSDDVSWAANIVEVPGLYHLETTLTAMGGKRSSITKLEFLEPAGFYHGDLDEYLKNTCLEEE